MVKIVSRVNEVSYAIRDVVVKANEVEARGKKILKLNIGDPNVYDFDSPDFLRQAVCEAVNDKKNGYADSQGFKPLLEEVALLDKKKGVDTAPEDVVVSSGVSESLSMLFACMVEQGVEALFPSPCYPQYPGLMSLQAGESVFFDTPEEQAFDPDVDDFRKKITSKTAFALINNPCNPTGTVYSEKRVKELLGVCAEHDLIVLADEIYDDLVFDAPMKRAAALCKDVSIVSLNGISKNYVAPGWRIGWMVFNHFKDDVLKQAVLRLCRLRLCASYPAQAAAAKALNHPDFLAFNKQTVERLRKRRDLTYARLNEIEGLSCVKPNAAFYAFPQIHSDYWTDDKAFVYDLLEEKGVLTVFGSGFYASGKHFRVVFLPPEETLSKVFDEIEDFMKKRRE